MSLKVTLQNTDKMSIRVGRGTHEILWNLSFVLFVVWALYQWRCYPEALSRESFQGCAAAAVVALIGSLGLYERASFLFDKKTRLLTWSRRRTFSRRSGQISFSDIVVVGVENVLAYTKTNPARRVIIRTKNEVIPVSAGFTPGMSAQHHKLADQIQGFIKN